MATAPHFSPEFFLPCGQARPKEVLCDRVRRGRLYCVGTGKSGTHSIAAMFSGTVRSRHEPRAVQLMEQILARASGRTSDREFAEWLHQRDRELALEVDSSHLNYDILDFLIREFPDARFVLTIRDCYSWCNSLLNDAVRSDGKIHPLWREIGRLRFRNDKLQHAPEEELLKKHGFRSLASNFSYWTRHNMEVIDKVSPAQLLVVRTDQIHDKAMEIADFAKLPRRAVCLERTYQYRNPAKQPFLQQIDRHFVEAMAQQYCQPLMTRFFPEIKSLDDVQL
jgi:hypothetical protein